MPLALAVAVALALPSVAAPKPKGVKLTTWYVILRMVTSISVRMLTLQKM